MAAAAATEQIPIPPTYRFRPKKRELVEHYLLPRARGQDPFPGAIFEDEAAGSTLPWDLFERHGVESEEEAYFIVRTSEANKSGARQDRGCDGGFGIWKMQKSFKKCLRVRGERITIHVSNLNLHMGKGKKSGSVGWVMHEYTVAAPPCPSFVKICHISFSGHGRKRMRVPDGQEVCQSSGHAGVGATTASGSSAVPCSGAMLDHGSSGATYAFGDEEPSQLVLTNDNYFRQSPLLGSSDFQGFPSAASEQYPELEARVPTTEQQNILVPQLMVPQSTTMPVSGQLSPAELEFWRSIGVDVESNESFDQEQSTEIQCKWVVPNNGAMATGGQSSWVAPNNGAIATGSQSSWVVPGATGVQSSYVVPSTGAMATGFQSSYVVPSTGAMAAGFQSSYVVPTTGAMATGVQSSYVVPNNGAMATGVQSSMAGDLDDFCRSLLSTMQTNCAVPDFGNMATRTLGGGCSLICK